MDFKLFRELIAKQFNKMSKLGLYKVEIDKDLLWNTYLDSFPEGTNEIYKERRYYDCSCCRSFIKSVGNVVAIDKDYNLITIWDIKTEDIKFQIVSDALSKLVKTCKIKNVFLHSEKTAGVDKNFQQLLDKTVQTWYHFFINIPTDCYMNGESIGSVLGDKRSTFDVLYRGLNELTLESLDTVLELISQNSLYRGEEHTHNVKEFRKIKNDFNKLKDNQKENYCWSIIKKIPVSICRIRNSAIGTLLIDISNDVDLDHAVSAFERVVAPMNYKRPTAIVTKKMIDDAKKEIEKLGLTSALQRRFANINDISINNILYADMSIKKVLEKDIFDIVAEEVPNKTDIKKLDKIQEVTIDEFIKNIIPNAKSIEVLFENKHNSNLVSLVAPTDPTCKPLFKWNNNFSWSYTGEVADSIKQRVKSAGGNINADLCCRLAWFNYDDLDLHMRDPRGNHIYYANRVANYGTLDVDMNAGTGKTRTPVENIYYQNKNNMTEGIYRLQVHNFHKRENIDTGFTVEFDFMGKVNTFHYNSPVRHEETINVIEFEYSKKDGIKIIKSLPCEESSNKIWNINTTEFHKVNSIMLSPNYWDEYNTGNKHYFFMIDKCINDGTARGFFNEFLNEELNKHRKVLELVGCKLKLEESDNQLSGLGFSSTQPNNLIVKVNGNFSRMIKIIF